MVSTDTNISILPKTSPLTLKKLRLKNIYTLLDLISIVPRRYKDYRTISPISHVLKTYATNFFQENDDVPSIATIQGIVTKTLNRHMRGSFSMQQVTVADKTSEINAIWFRQPYILTMIKKGDSISVSGTVKKFSNTISIQVDEFDICNSSSVLVNTGRLIPVYSESIGISTRTLREKIQIALSLIIDELPEGLPRAIIKKYQLISLRDAYTFLHKPESDNDIQDALKRLGFDELFTIQLASSQLRDEWKRKKKGNIIEVNTYNKEITDFIRSLNFTLTNSQKNVTKEIFNDLQQSTPMNRLLQGDVGSGKTIVAAILAYCCYLNNFQTVIMAPTSVLCHQHFETFSQLFKKYENITVGLHTGTVKSKLDENIIIGTHALLAKKSIFKKVGLVIIDEQHKFGVSQRAEINIKGANPHVLTMTATPIPRSVALTLYGELDFSSITELPPGRKPVKTFLVPFQKREKSYEWMKSLIKKENVQVFIVCPFIEESTHETMQSVKAVTSEYLLLKDRYLKNVRIGLLHGALSQVQKNDVMNKFKNHEIDVLLSTPVVEVGIDIPNASIMVIEGAERFGLASLHQLRGRVGRGSSKSYCLLYTSSDTSSERLSYFCKTASGFLLAEYDLKHRGTGELYGTRQHGQNDLAIASLSDSQLVSNTNAAVKTFLKKYKISDYPLLKKKLELHTLKLISFN